MKKNFIIIDAPSHLGLKPPSENTFPGVYKLPLALKEAGFADILGANTFAQLDVPVYTFGIDNRYGIRNVEEIQSFTKKLANILTQAIKEQTFPIVLGGDCSILLGSMLGLKKAGNYGLFFIDAHLDLLSSGTSTTGGAAGMDLALVTGRGPEILTNIDHQKPYVTDEHVVAFGFNKKVNQYVKDFAHSKINFFSLDHIREKGIRKATLQALDSIGLNYLDGIWIHLDVDVLDKSIMPAVDSPERGGMLFDELIQILNILMEQDKTAGIEITIYDPDLDKDLVYAKLLTNALVKGLTGETK